MNRIIFLILTLFLICACIDNSNQYLISKVDERFELTSIAFRLAEAEEYVNDNIPTYTKEIDEYFKPFSNHELISYIKDTLIVRDEIAYDAVAFFACRLEKSNGSWILSKENSAFLLKDPRWKEETLSELVKLLNDFYTTTKFEDFYNTHQKLYSNTETNYNKLLKKVDLAWFESFFGKGLPKVPVYVSLCNGRHNYSLGERGIVMGCYAVNEGGIPIFDDSMLPILIHEFSHILTNPLVTEYYPQLESAGDTIYPHVEQLMLNAAYSGIRAIYGEGLNDLFVNIYFLDHNIGNINYEIYRAEKKGFVWMQDAVDFMENFRENRKEYPIINEFMPQLVSYMNQVATNIDMIMKEHDLKYPRVVNVYPALNTKVDASTKEVRITFSHSMRGSIGVSSIENISYPVANGTSLISTFFSYRWTNDDKTLILDLQDLDKGEKYGFSLNKDVMQSMLCFPMRDNFEIRFETKK